MNDNIKREAASRKLPVKTAKEIFFIIFHF
jgi:hypothetical protein